MTTRDNAPRDADALNIAWDRLIDGRATEDQLDRTLAHIHNALTASVAPGTMDHIWQRIQPRLPATSAARPPIHQVSPSRTVMSSVVKPDHTARRSTGPIATMSAIAVLMLLTIVVFGQRLSQNVAAPPSRDHSMWTLAGLTEESPVDTGATPVAAHLPDANPISIALPRLDITLDLNPDSVVTEALELSEANPPPANVGLWAQVNPNDSAWPSLIVVTDGSPGRAYSLGALGWVQPRELIVVTYASGEEIPFVVDDVQVAPLRTVNQSWARRTLEPIDEPTLFLAAQRSEMVEETQTPLGVLIAATQVEPWVLTEYRRLTVEPGQFLDEEVHVSECEALAYSVVERHRAQATPTYLPTKDYEPLLRLPSIPAYGDLPLDGDVPEQAVLSASEDVVRQLVACRYFSWVNLPGDEGRLFGLFTPSLTESFRDHPSGYVLPLPQWVSGAMPRVVEARQMTDGRLILVIDQSPLLNTLQVITLVPVSIRDGATWLVDEYFSVTRPGREVRRGDTVALLPRPAEFVAYDYPLLEKQPFSVGSGEPIRVIMRNVSQWTQVFSVPGTDARFELPALSALTVTLELEPGSYALLIQAQVTNIADAHMIHVMDSSRWPWPPPVG